MTRPMEFLFPLILLVPLLLIFLSNRRRQQAVRSVQDRIAVGQQVMTSSGMFGEVVEVDTETVHLLVADGVRTRWARPAVARIVTDPAAEAAAVDDEVDTSGDSDTSDAIDTSEDRVAGEDDDSLDVRDPSGTRTDPRIDPPTR